MVNDQSIFELQGENELLKVKLKTKAKELSEEVANAKADYALWVHDLTIQQFAASSLMFKWLEKYIPADEEE